jgi:hypothetical protein
MLESIKQKYPVNFNIGEPQRFTIYFSQNVTQILSDEDLRYEMQVVGGTAF